jgi:hypothetical protein
MRNRHIPRVCRQCHAPLASTADPCWRCGVEWAAEDQPPAKLRLVPSGPPDLPGSLAPAPPATRRVAAAIVRS